MLRGCPGMAMTSAAMRTATRSLIVVTETGHVRVLLAGIVRAQTGLFEGRVVGKVERGTTVTVNVSLRGSTTDGGGKTMREERLREPGAGVVFEYLRFCFISASSYTSCNFTVQPSLCCRR